MEMYDLTTALYNDFEALKRIDENGVEFWYGHDLANILGYSQFNKMIPAIERAIESIAKRGINPHAHIQQITEYFINGRGYKVPVNGYRMTRIGAYYVALNGDTGNDAVSTAQAYFIDSTVTLDSIKENISDLEYMAIRNNLKNTNKVMKRALIRHGVPENRLGVVLDNGYRGLFDQSAKELKESLNLPKTTEISDILGPELACIKGTATAFSRATIEKYNINGIDATGKVVYEQHREMRDKVEELYDRTPESMLPGKNVKNIERRYNKNIRSMLKNDGFDN